LNQQPVGTGSTGTNTKEPVVVSVNEQVVVVTGASGGIGRATPVAYAAPGANVA
jgi:hypothetical protein